MTVCDVMCVMSCVRVREQVSVHTRLRSWLTSEPAQMAQKQKMLLSYPASLKTCRTIRSLTRRHRRTLALVWCSAWQKLAAQVVRTSFSVIYVLSRTLPSPPHLQSPQIRLTLSSTCRPTHLRLRTLTPPSLRPRQARQKVVYTMR